MTPKRTLICPMGNIAELYCKLCKDIKPIDGDTETCYDCNRGDI